MDTIRVLLVDDHAMMRESLAAALEGQAGIHVVGQAGDGEQALGRIGELQPDVVILDYSMQEGPDGLGTMKRLADTGGRTKVLFLSMHSQVPYALQALDAGAMGYVVKRGALSELVQAVKSVHAGEEYVSPCLAEEVVARRKGSAGRAGLQRLSPREFELLRHLGSGLSLQEAAQRMGVVESTASTYRSRLMGKLGLGSTQQIIRFAIQHGIVG